MEWVTFNEDDDDDDDDNDEALSLSDLPIAAQPEKKHEEARGPTIKDDFEFRILGNGRLSPDPHMCAAEDVFFHGKLLPLGGPIRPVARSYSPGLHSWRSVSSSTSNSSCVSRSLSSNSCASSSDAPRPPPSRLLSNAFYAFPSPSPRVGPGRKSRNLPARRSTGSVPPVGWGLLRLGVAMAPEIELQDIRVRRGGGSKPSSVKRSSVNVVSRLLGCSCSPEDSISAADVLIVKKKGKGTEGRRRERMFQWLEELSIGKR